MSLVLDPVENVIAAIAAGRMIVLVDDANRENEGDLVVAASLTTPTHLAFMMSEGRGLICASFPEERLRELDIPFQAIEKAGMFGTNFAVPVDAKAAIAALDAPGVPVLGSAMGITAQARATTIRTLMDPKATRADFVAPGCVIPLGAVPGGVLKRRGQTEGSVDLARLAGLPAGGVICEIMGEDGEMLRGEALQQYCRTHALALTSVEELVRYRLRHEVLLRIEAESEVKDVHTFATGLGLSSELVERLLQAQPQVRLFAFVDEVDDREQLAIVVGSPTAACLTRVHSECLTGDVFGSRRCDCGFQLAYALEQMLQEGEGCLLYLYQEGRGIGLGNKLRAYELQDQGLDTVDANHQLGFPADARSYRAAAQMLTLLEISSIRLMTNNPRKVASLTEFEVQVVERIPVLSPVDEFNANYLKTKREKLGHFL